jgi:large repetitive protein
LLTNNTSETTAVDAHGRCHHALLNTTLQSAVFSAILCVASPAFAQPPSLGSAQSFAVLGGQSVTVAGTGTIITGDVGVSPGTSITGIPAGGTVAPPFSTHSNDALAVAAQAAVTSLYSTLAGTTGAVPIVAELGGEVLTPGTYSFGSTANIAAGTTLTLNGAGTYIFQVGSAITANVGSNVVLINGASACNVFWQITSAATLNGVTFSGTVVAQAGITLGVGAALSGRALTTAAGAVTMAGTNMVGGCSGPTGGCPTITIAPATLPDGTVGVPYSQTITGSGGAAAYTFDVTAGAPPPGLTLSSAGLLAGTPTAAGTFTLTIRATDANGCTATITYTVVIAPVPPVCPAITLAPASLPDGTVGVAYGQTITASGGAGPYTFDVTIGTPPPGLTLTSPGLLAGTPTTAGTFTLTIRATDANGCTATITYTVIIAPAVPVPPVCPAITLAPSSLPNGTVGVAYIEIITGTGGTGPYSFGVTAGALPSGLSLTPGGVLSGTPSFAGSATFTLRGTDADGCLATASYSVTVAAPPPVPPICPTITVSPSTLPTGIAGSVYSQAIGASGGTAPYGFGVTAGALPTGITLSAAGVLSGTPATAGQSVVTVRATAANGCFAERSFDIFVLNAVPTLPQALKFALALALSGIGYFLLRRRALNGHQRRAN